MEAADSTTNSSKVIVQCHDPSNLFDRVVPRLEPRLPLSKLHWKSPNRPLRSIDQLHVSFVRDDTKPDGPAGARRHQIPGLRQTPFVKVYLARCDERESYKETCRKDIKQWLKSQGISQDGKTLMKGQERHDAYEYIILHVVLPGTAAAAQPKSSKHISLEASESTDSLNSKSKWTGKSQSTIYDKLRADFSSSSKAPFERVAQIRITDPENKQPNGLGPSELEEQWQDFVEKLKTAILLSLDVRVSQYEDDIREREAQRQLPGWNFCTFFILKEGLARGFETVGLMDDALTVYEELDAGLDTLVQEQISQEDPDPTSALIPFSTDLKPTIRLALDKDVENGQEQALGTSISNLQSLIDLERSNFPFDVERKNYQQRILTNQVSALDFHIYVFTRQIQLLFRQARINVFNNKSRQSINSIPKAQYDVSTVAEICEKATGFISFASRALRRDLYAAWGGQEGLSETELRTQQVVVGAIVGSWKWAAIMQILADCQIPSLLSHLLEDDVVRSGKTADGSMVNSSEGANGQLHPFQQDLALWVGELILMARDVLSTSILEMTQYADEVDAAKGLQSASLSHLLQSKETASEVFKLFTIQAYQCFHAADRISASHRMLHALAEIELARDQVDKAVWWLEHIPNLVNLHARSVTDRVILRLYAKCLKQQGRIDEYATTLIALLLSSAVSPVARALPRYDEQTQHVLNELIGVNDTISEMQLPLDGFFAIRNIDKAISLNDQKYSFSLFLTLSLRFDATLNVPSIQLNMNTADGQGPTDIILNTTDVVTIGPSGTRLKLSSHTITEGWYNLTRLTLTIGRFVFVHDFQLTTSDDETEKLFVMDKPFPIMVYPQNDSFTVTAASTDVVDLTQSGRLLFTISPGAIGVDQCELYLRPATAGVRFDIQAAECLTHDTSHSFEILRQDDLHLMALSDLPGQTIVSIEVPCSNEVAIASITTRIEARCKIGPVEFTAYYQRVINTNLPISINVQDIFQADRLFSRFTATPSTTIPLRILIWDIQKSDTYEIRHGDTHQTPVDVFPKMLGSWIVEVVDHERGQRNKNRLPLTVQYQSFDDVILNNVETRFRDDLRSSPAYFASELLVPHLLSQLTATWTEQDLEAAVLLQEFELFSFDDLNWTNTLRALALTDRKEVDTWLRSWHTKNRLINLNISQARIRQVKLSVDIPNPAVIVSTSLDLHLSPAKYLTVGEPVSADLSIECFDPNASDVKFQFDVIGQLDSWLVGGKRRGVMAAETSKTIFSVILIPQKTGHLLLPSVEIKSRASTTQMSIEVENKSQAKSVLVIPGLQSTTVAIGNDEMSGRHWLADSRDRPEPS